MSAPLCATQTSFSDTELNAPYSATSPLLPTTRTVDTDRESTGMLRGGVVTARIEELKNLSIIPIPTPTDPSIYVNKQATFIANVKAEYCYYESRYKYALNQLFSFIAASYATNPTDNRTNINTYLLKTQQFNEKLNDLTQIINGIVTYMLNISSSVDSEITIYNTRILEKQKALDEQNRIISANDASSKIKKEMVRYTEEKGRNTNNLLNLYGFLNVVAVGLLVYVYKAAGDE
jgi:hypothetical protein